MSHPLSDTGSANPMSAKEQQVLLMLARGLRAREIARRLQVSPSYIYHLIRLLKARFDANTLIGMLNRAAAMGILSELEDITRLAEAQPEGEGV